MTPAVDMIAAAGIGCFAVLLFAYSAIHKLADFTAFTGFVEDYHLLPERAVVPVAALVAGAEAVVVLALLVPGLRAFGLILGAALLLGYAVGMGVNLRRGRRRIECGCGGAPQPISVGLVVRNLVLAGVMLLAAAHLGGPLGAAGLIAALAAGVALFGVYLLANQLMGNTALFRARLQEAGL